MIDPCNCTTPVKNPIYNAHIITGGVCIFSAGATVEEAVANVRQHAKRDHIKRRDWIASWVQRIDNGDEVWYDGFSTPYKETTSR